jgi:hypothetical protein
MSRRFGESRAIRAIGAAGMALSSALPLAARETS